MPDTDNLKRILLPVIRALGSERDVEAARRLVEVLAHDTVLQKANLVSALSMLVGKTATMRLIRAFASYPCIGCRNGLDVCANCEGSGTFDTDRVCDLCIGLGVTDCGFCAGSALITYNFVPAGLRLAVVLERSQLVVRRAETLLCTPLPTADRRTVAEATKLTAKQLLMTNRLLGALNNAVGETHSRRTNTADARLPARISSLCMSCGKRLRRRVRELLRLLQDLSVQGVLSATVPSKRRALARRANYYKKLAVAPSFRGTGLYQVFLDNAEIGDRRDKPA